jgi:hypothetical protein
VFGFFCGGSSGAAGCSTDFRFLAMATLLGANMEDDILAL